MNNETEVIAYHQRHSRSLKNASTASHVSTGFVGLYIRVSTVDQGERYSPASQLKRLREKAAREGKQVRDEDIFIDYHTGKQESRPGFDRLKERVKSGAIDSVYVYDVSRFARRTLDALKVWSEFRKHGVSLEFYETPFEDTPAGRFAFTQMAAVAEFMGAKIVEDSKRGSLEKLQRGQLTHGSAPYGYKYIDKRDPQNPSSFQINENQAPIAREIFERRVQKWRKYSIARELNNRGIPAAKGGPWNYGSISQMLHNPTYMGTHVREGIIVPCPVIVSPELWSACQQVQDECRRAHVGRPPKRFLLVGYLWCGRCGHRCATVQDGKEYRAYRCHNVTSNRPPIHRNCPAPGVKAALIEERAWNSIWQLLTDPKRLLEIARDYFESLKNARPQFSRSPPPGSREAPHPH